MVSDRSTPDARSTTRRLVGAALFAGVLLGVLISNGLHAGLHAGVNALLAVGLIGTLLEFVRRTRQRMTEADRELAEAQMAAEAAGRAKADFLAAMSHEMRTPMNAIINMSELVLETKLTDRQKKYLETIDSSARSLTGIVNDILDFNRIDAGGLALESSFFKPERLIRDVAESFRDHEKIGALRFETHLGGKVPENVATDRLRLRQVLTHLVGNAFKFTEAGRIDLSVFLVGDAPEGATEATLRFSVKDTGIGIDEQELPRLLESFSQADASATRRYGGTGLGLAICDRLVKLMGGSGRGGAGGQGRACQGDGIPQGCA